MNISVPRGVFLTKGVGAHKEELHSFELALRNAGIEKCNLVQVSSILPPGCRVVSRKEGLKIWDHIRWSKPSMSLPSKKNIQSG